MDTPASLLVAELYSVSDTLRRTTPLNPKILDLAKKVSILLDQKAKSTSLSIEDIASFQQFLADLVNAPTSLRGIYRLRIPLRILAQYFLELTETQPPVKDEFLDVYPEFIEALELSPDFDIYDGRPLLYDSPLLYFHYCAYTFSVLDKIESNCPLYTAFGPIFHAAIRVHERRNPTDSMYSGRLLAGRHFFEYLSERYKRMPAYLHPEVTSDDFIPYMDDAMQNFSTATTGSESGLSRTAKDYRYKIKSLLLDFPLRRRSSGSQYPTDPEEEETIYPPNYPGVVNVISVEQDAGADSDDHPIPEQQVDAPGDSPIRKKRPHLASAMSPLAHMRNFVFYIDPKYLSLHHYSVLYAVLMATELLNVPLYDVIVLFLYILIHTGIAPKVLINLATGLDTPTETTPALLFRDGRYYIDTPLLIRGVNPQAFDHCPQSRDTVLIPLSDKIGKLIGRISLTAKGPVFSFMDKHGRKKVDLQTIADFLNASINKSPQYSGYDFRITVFRIARSFDALYVSRFGMDPIIAALIRSDKRQHLFRSQAHYIFILRFAFERHYVNRYNLVDNAILANLHKCVGNNMISLTAHPESVLMLSDQSVLQIDESNTEGYGSSIIPSTSYINNMITVLNHSILSTRNELLRFNLFTIYVYLCLQFCVGLRPHNKPQLHWSDYSESKTLIVIRDKESAQYHEERLLPLPPVMCSLLATLRRAADSTRQYIKTEIDPNLKHMDNDAIFFFFGADGSMEDFRIDKSRKLLKSIGIDYVLRANMPRHFLRNTLYHACTSDGFIGKSIEADISKCLTNDSIDVFIGHNHAGREILNLYSSSTLAGAAKHCLPVIIRMIDDLGFKIPHLWK